MAREPIREKTKSVTSNRAPRRAAVRRDLATMAEAAEYARLSVRTIRRYVADGRLTGYKVGPRLIRVDLDEVDSIMRPFGGAA